MNAHSEPSVDDLRRESERTRASLTSTVEELRDKVGDTATEWKQAVSPSHIKAEVKDYVRESGEQLSESIRRRVRENPLQAAAIGVGLAYPLLGLLRTVPAPLMLIGAGLWLTQQKRSGSYGTQEDSLVEKTGNLASQATMRAGEVASSAQHAAQDAMARGVDKVSTGVSDAASAVSAQAGAVTDQVRRMAHDARDAATNMTQRVTDTLQSTASSVSTAAADTMVVAKDKVYQASVTSRDTVMDFIDRNPLVVAGAGLAVGAFIAASLPTSQVENRLLGETSDALKEKARRSASEGLDRAKNVASEVAGDVAAAADLEGLNAQGVRQTVGNVAEGAKAVADRGLKAAFGDKPAPGNGNQTFKNKGLSS